MPSITRLSPPDRIGVVAPASPPLSQERLDRGVSYLRSLGFDVVQPRTSYPPYGYLAGSDEERLGELNALIRTPDIKALFCVRGGYGSLRLLPDLDYAAARRHPKILVGYSDITALHMALYRHAGWKGISGNMVAVEWPEPDKASEKLFFDLFAGEHPSPLLGPAGETLSALRPGEAEGVLLGGNLTLISRLVGTPYLPDLRGALLFIEEVGESPYRLDGLLAQLSLSGILERLGGLLFGGFTDAEPTNDRPTLSVEEVIAHYARQVNGPVATGLVYGHFPVKTAMPVGVRARLRCSGEEATLSLLDPLVG